MVVCVTARTVLADFATLPRYGVIRYRVIFEPWLLVGIVQPTMADALRGTAMTLGGADGRNRAEAAECAFDVAYELTANDATIATAASTAVDCA